MRKMRKKLGAYLERRHLVSIGHTFFCEIKRLFRYGFFYPPAHFDIEDKKITYLIVQKVACSSIKSSMAHRDFEQNSLLHQSLISIPGTERLQIETFKFSFVRNPFDWLVSCYESKYHKDAQNKSKKFLEFDCYLLGIIAKDHGFEPFIKAICRIPKRLANSHFRSQYLTLYRHGKCVADYVGKFENLENDYEAIREKYNFARLKHYNKSDKGNWMDYYTPKTAKMVYRKFRKDFETFGYQAEYEKLLAHLNTKTVNKNSE